MTASFSSLFKDPMLELTVKRCHSQIRKLNDSKRVLKLNGGLSKKKEFFVVQSPDERYRVTDIN